MAVQTRDTGRNSQTARLLDRVRLLDIAGVVVFLIIWQILSLFMDPSRLPSPLLVAGKIVTILHRSKELIAQRGGGTNLLPHLAYTIIRTLTGAACGTAMGISVGLIMGRNRAIRDILGPPIEAVRAIPPLGAIPFLLMWFGPGPISQFALIALYCFLVVVIYTLNAIRNVDPIYPQFAKTLGADDRVVFRTVVLPAMLPELIGGVRVALAMSWGLEVVAEMMGAPFGMGKFFVLLVPFFATSSVIAGIVILAIVAWAFDRLFTLAAGYLIRWVPR